MSSTVVGASQPSGEARRVKNAPQPATEPDQAREPAAAVVLIAEDEEPIAAAIASVVEDAGYEPVLATNGQEALASARERHPALVLTDMMMPRMDGLQLIAALRTDAATDGHSVPPIILMTAAGPQRAREAGVDAILWKPFDITQLEQLLDRFLAPPATLGS
jgi:CheY-like chemotaxis protein